MTLNKLEWYIIYFYINIFFCVQQTLFYVFYSFRNYQNKKIIFNNFFFFTFFKAHVIDSRRDIRISWFLMGFDTAHVVRALRHCLKTKNYQRLFIVCFKDQKYWGLLQIKRFTKLLYFKKLQLDLHLKESIQNNLFDNNSLNT